MPLYLLDTNMATFIVTARSQAAQQRYADRRDGDRIAISAISEGEIRYGLARQSANTQTSNFMHRFLDTVDSLPWDSKVTFAYGSLRAQLAGSGQVLSALDTLIAAHAIAVGAILVTHDYAFRRLDPRLLEVQDWAIDI